MFKVGDRVKKINGKPFSNGDYVVTVKKIDGSKIWFKETDSFFTDKRIKLAKVIKWNVKESVNMNSEKTFRELIIGWCNVKPYEIWESEYFIISKDVDGDLKIEHKEGFNECVGIFINPEDVFKPQRKQYTFTEAFAAYEEGKEIESCVSKCRFIKGNLKGQNKILNDEINEFTDIAKGYGLEFEEIRGKWYINN